jgi:hypothetical protein
MSYINIDARQELFNYIKKHYPDLSSDVTLTHLVHNVWKNGVSRALTRAKQIEKDHELDERISYFIKDLLKDTSP